MLSFRGGINLKDYGLWSARAKTPLIWLLRDDFLTAEAAPITTPRTCEPGPGTLVVVQNDGQFSIVGENLVFPGQTTPAWGDQYVVSNAMSRAAALTAMLAVNHTTMSNGAFGWYSDATPSDPSVDGHCTLNFTSVAGWYTRANDGGVMNFLIADGTTGVDYIVAVTLFDDYAFIFVIGGIYTDWEILYVQEVVVSPDPVYASFDNYNSTGTGDFIRVAVLPDWETALDLTTNYVTSPVVDEVMVSEADHLVEFTWTAVAGETLEISVRRTDDNNRWIVRGSQAGSTIKLIEVNGGGETERSSAAQIWGAGSDYRVVISSAGTTIRTFVNRTSKNTYTSAAYNQTATGTKVNKTGANFIAWPRNLGNTVSTTLAGHVRGELNRMSGA